MSNGITIISPQEEPILPMFWRIWGKRVYLPPDYEVSVGDTVVDIGANVGVFTLLAASRGARVVALEPSPRISACLQENVTRNKMKKVIVCKAACGKTSGTAVLYGQGYETNNSLYPRDVFGNAYSPICEVPLMSLEDIFDSFGVARCDLLKMNCEGAEYEVLLCAPAGTLERVQRIAMEYHLGRQNHRPEELAQFLTREGFEVTLLPLHDEEGGYLYATKATKG